MTYEKMNVQESRKERRATAIDLFRGPLNQSVRKKLVVFIIINTLLYLLVYTTDLQVGESALSNVLTLIVGLYLFLGTPLLAARLWVSVRMGTAPDERQSALQDRSFRLSYQAVLWSAFGVLTYTFVKLDELSCYHAGFAGQCIEHVVNRWYLLSVFGGLLFFASFLPTLVRAWLEPDPIQNETPQLGCVDVSPQPDERGGEV